MAKNSIFDPTKDGVKADNSGYSSNQIDKMIGESAAALIDDETAGDDNVYSSAKIYSLLPEDTATGAEVTITDACPDLPIVELTAEINAVQEGTGDPSPDNVRPISGWDEITITHDDIDVEISLGDDTVYGGTYNSDGTLTITHAYFTITQFDAQGVIQSRLPVRITTPLPRWQTNIGTELDNIMCDTFLPDLSSESSAAAANLFTCRLASGNNNRVWFFIPTATASTLEEANTWVAENNINIVYPLLTPIELTVGTLAFNTNGEGSTIISCDSGDVTVKYKKLTTLS